MDRSPRRPDGGQSRTERDRSRGGDDHLNRAAIGDGNARTGHWPGGWKPSTSSNTGSRVDSGDIPARATRSRACRHMSVEHTILDLHGVPNLLECDNEGTSHHQERAPAYPGS